MSATRRLGRSVCSVSLRACSTKSKRSPLKSILENATLYEELRSKSEWATKPYTVLPSENYQEKTLDPIESTIILFPGQGTQHIDMGKKLLKFPGVKELYECASEVAGFDLKNIQTLQDLKKYCQLAIVTASLATIEQVREERPSVLSSCVATAGFSLGEITALIFSGAISLEEGLKLVNIRNLAMNAASKEHPGGMLTVMFQADANISLALQDAKDYCISHEISNPVCSIANYLYPHCKVISGSEKALQFLEQNSKRYGIRSTKKVEVSGAFHSQAMKPAIDPLRQALYYCSIEIPKISVYSATTCQKYRSPQDIKSTLIKQIVLPVKWEQLMQLLYNRPKGSRFPKTYEIGPDQSLRKILRKVNAPAWDNSISIFE